MVQLKILVPKPSEVTIVDAEEGEAIEPNPETKVQLPVPTEGIFAESVALLEQSS